MSARTVSRNWLFIGNTPCFTIGIDPNPEKNNLLTGSEKEFAYMHTLPRLDFNMLANIESDICA